MVLFLSLSFNSVSAQQEGGTPGGDPYPMFTPTLPPTPAGYPAPATEADPDRVPYPMQEGTAAVTPTSTLEGMGDATPTPTLIPLPTLNLIFPAFSPTPSPTATSAPQVLNEERNLLVQIDNRLDRQIESIGILIVLIWLLLGIFLILYLKRLGY
jgi:hypothetical protein